MTEYWKNRFLKTSKDIYKADDEYVKELFNIYKETTESLNAQISNILNSFEDMTMAEAKKMLNKAELRGFKDNLKDFERKSKGFITKDIEKELELTYKRVRISRLQAMEVEIKAYISNLLTKEQRNLFNHLTNVYKGAYYQDIYELQKVTGFSTIKALSEIDVKNIVNTSWLNDGKGFSDRIWKRKDHLINTLNREFRVALITGKSVNEITKMISDKLNVSRSNAKRLVVTESSAVCSKARIETIRMVGAQRYEIVATLDLRTSKICRAMDGKVFNENEYVQGITAPPFHVNCRSTIAPFYDDEIQDIIEGGKRIARDPVTGKSLYVDNTTYKEWYEKYVK